MGCTTSKPNQIKATVDVYRPAPTSFAVFDINAIQEPWLMINHKPQEHQEKEDKPSHVPVPILEKLHTLEKSDSPLSWDEVSKSVLSDLKPKPEPNTKPVSSSAKAEPAPPNKNAPRKSMSFHTVEELDAKAKKKKLTPNKPAELRKTESMRAESTRSEWTQAESTRSEWTQAESESLRSVKENIFVVRDRMEREKEGKVASFNRWDPLSEFPEKCPKNGGADSVVLYTTSLRGVRRTYEECNRARSIFETHRVVVDERDVSLHSEFRTELKELLGESDSVSVPRVFVKGRYIGGVEELVELNESGRLGKILSHARVERGVGRQACEGCGGMRFVPCLECGGSCKVLKNGDKERCEKCNENGLVQCPACN
ncbi:hypothetical protein SO802_003100 [Lithocarpus litseifolius]|uniref:Glutaredoxin domain-containing protein n=1 Tax=Lithocarpus litseifolius TaxID=425828 RepID=A0AAW2E030_9ROSI